ncbi:PepSY domain-containing protein [Dyadobacter sp. CY356]|uniref:PepSY-associated TM helix domain-containing protein n=1 Tax=Dyadobacter sp. CY356 TaxID=2906442 RepID=UPI001F17FCDF|nr:PepSY-associated TM helix domain-containing protein [Dyadobacter sp. CY356]MCF0055888.1 PepSY domain-containing protein [Dyadobacter sp. CY356]
MTTFKKVNNFLHLWLGLISGIIVFIVCITGCIWVFNEEIEGLLEPETKIERQDKAVIMPSQLMQIAKASYPDIKVSYANYQQGRAINLGLGERRGPNITLKINPYTGEIISKDVHKKGETSFFRWVLNGHRFLWLPFEIGRPIVNYGTLVFVILLITGLIWWYPKKWTKTTTDKSFKIKWGASFKRVNLDLHNVLGFYSLLFLLAIALTGMVYGIKWYSQGLYWATSGGKSLPGREREITSDSLMAGKFFTPQQAIDKAWLKVISENPKAEGFYYTFPDSVKAKSAIYITIYPNSGQFYNNRSYSFDQHTLKELPKDEVYGASYDGAPFGTKLRKMNYDIHVGSILGFPGKVLAFLSSLIGASLPVTGFLVWWGRKGFGKKGKKNAGRIKKFVSEDLSENQENISLATTSKFKPGLIRNKDLNEKTTIDS